MTENSVSVWNVPPIPEYVNLFGSVTNDSGATTADDCKSNGHKVMQRSPAMKNKINNTQNTRKYKLLIFNFSYVDCNTREFF